MRAPKKCSCGIAHSALPLTGRISLPEFGGAFAGYYAECSCGSTMWWTWSEFIAEIRVLDGTDIPASEDAA